jgi:hypothetical protein
VASNSNILTLIIYKLIFQPPTLRLHRLDVRAGTSTKRWNLQKLILI